MKRPGFWYRFRTWWRQKFCNHDRRYISNPEAFVYSDAIGKCDYFCVECGKTWLFATEREHRHALARIKADEMRLTAEAKQKEAIRRLETSFGIQPTGEEGALSLVENVHPIKKTS